MYVSLTQVYEELVQAVKEAEEGLFHLKRARLLREADSILQDSKYIAEDVKAEPLDSAEVEAEPLEDEGYRVGSKCRFRHTDGRWYNGLIVGLEGSDSAKISFLTPTSENMLVSKIFRLVCSFWIIRFVAAPFELISNLIGICF